jgi:transposase InsO family protein
LLRQEGWATSRTQVQRLRRAEGLRVSLPRQRRVRRGVSTGLPTQATHRGQVWTWDFVADATVHGGVLRMLTVLDEHTKEVHVLRPERRIGSADVIALVKAAIAQHGAPEFIRSDNGSEFIAHDPQRWLADQQIKTIYITPASPWENGFVESFHSRFRDECLNRGQLWTLTEARVVIEDFRQDYHAHRPHSSLGYQSPHRFAAQLASSIHRSGQPTASLRDGLPTSHLPAISINFPD